MNDAMNSGRARAVAARIGGLGIRARLALLVAATLVPSVLLLGLGASLERDRALASALDEYEAEAAQIAERIAATVDRVRTLLVAAEATVGARLAEGARHDETLQRILGAAPHEIAWVNLVDERGRIVASSAVPREQRERINLADREHFQAAMRTGAFTISAPVISRVSGEPIVAMVQPVAGAGGAPVGVLIAVVEMAKLAELLETRTGLAALATDRGEVMLVPGRRELWGRAAFHLPQFAAARGGTAFRGETVDLDGTPVIGASVPVRNAPWQVFYGVAREAALAPLRRWLIEAVAATALMLAAGLALAGWLGRGIVREILQLRRGVNALARGDLEHRIASPPEGELGELAADVNRMAARLGEAEQRLKSLVALSSDFFWESDAELRFTRLEGRFSLPDDLAPAQLLGKRFWDFGYRLNGDIAAHRRLIERRAPFRDVEIVRWGEHGAIAQVLHVSGEPVYGADGAFLGYRGVGRDVTERQALEAEVRHAQHSLARSEARFRSVAEMSSDWIWETDAELRLTYLSDGYARATGHMVADALGKRLGEAPALDFADAQPDSTRALLAARSPFDDLRLHRRRPDGTRIVVSLSGRPLFSPEGAFLGYRGIGRDVSAQVAAEEALRAERDRLSRILETMAEGLVILDAEGRYVLMNSAAERIVGARRAGLVGRHFLDVPWRRHAYGGAEDALPQNVFERLRRGERTGFGPALYAIERADGSRRIVSQRAVRMADAAGAFTGLLLTLEDVTERVAAEEEHRREILALNADLERRVEERTAELAQAYKEMEAFSYSVSHDLRAPLRAISGFSRILLEDFRGELPSEAERLLLRVAQNAERMGVLIDGLLEFGRLSRQPLRLSRVRPADLVREVLEELAPQREGRRIDIRVGDMPECEADRVLLKQVYANLIANAIKYTSRCAEARIEVGAITMGLGPVYYVRDNGVGFDMVYAGKLFGMFQRLHLPTEFEGNGIGLALVRRIVERHGGKVWADAAPGKGATFFFRLGGAVPLARGGEKQAAA
ncbi:MAG: PAS domain S-box protein [Burkholderiales bacterium]|nr:PAS domain S-box protein [Burkholderiales bacterium]